MYIILLSSLSDLTSHVNTFTIHTFGNDIFKYLHKSEEEIVVNTSFNNQWFRKYFQTFDYKGHTHHKSLPKYYPIKAQKLFTKYIILSDLNEKYQCKFKTQIADQKISESNTFEYFEIGKTSSNYWIDYDSFYCDTLLTLNGNLVWKINFFIIENSNVTINKTIREFEVRINANYANNPHDREILRNGGKVRDPIFDAKNKRWKYPAHFYIHEPNLWHNVWPIHTYDNRYFEYKHSFSPELGRGYPLKLFKNNTDHKSISQYYETIYFEQMIGFRWDNYSHFNVTDYMDDLNAMKYYKSTLQNTPFQVMVGFGEYKHYKFDTNMPKLFCDNPRFHFDEYQSVIPKEITMKINQDIISLPDDIDIFVFSQRIGRWYFGDVKDTAIIKDQGKWLEPDCEWKRYEYDELESKIFLNSNMQMKFVGASNYQRIIGEYWSKLCPGENGQVVYEHGSKCTEEKNLKNNHLNIEWQFFRGSCMNWPHNGGGKCSDIWTEQIVNGDLNEYDTQKSCQYLFGLIPQILGGKNHSLTNITLFTTGLWLQRYSNISHIIKLYDGIEYLFEDCWSKFNQSMDILAMFYKQSFATSAAPNPDQRFELARFINGQIERYIDLALKAIMKNKPYLIGVIWSFERSFARHHTGDRMHQDNNFYKAHNHDIFTEIFRYIPSKMHHKCMSQFDRSCLRSIIKQF